MTHAAGSETRSRLPSALRSLRHRNYLLLISGNIVSQIGSWMQATALGWLVYRLTSDALKLGIVTFAAGIPILAFGLFAGMLVDSVNRHRLIILTQTFALVQALILGVLTLVHGPGGQPMISYWEIILLSALIGVVNSIDTPARQSFLLDVVPKEDLGNAVALNSLSFNAARVVGPAIAGWLVSFFQRFQSQRPGFGEGMCFMLNAVSFVAVIIALMKMDVSTPVIKKFKGSSEKYLIDGLRYVQKRPHMRAILAYVGVLAIFGIPYLTQMPVFAREVLHGDSTTFGNLLTSVGIGAMIGGILLARRNRSTGLGKIMVSATLGFCGAMIVFSLARSTLVACFAVGVAGFCMVTAMISSQTLVQMLLAENYRGRVMSLYNMMTVGLFPIGSLITGALAKSFGVRTAFIINSGVCMLAALAFWKELPFIRRSIKAAGEYDLLLGKRAATT